MSRPVLHRPLLGRPSPGRPALDRRVPGQPGPASPPAGGAASSTGVVGPESARQGGERIRYGKMIALLRILTRLAFGAALVGLVMPDPVGSVASATAVAVVVAAPLLRVAWLAVRWYGRGDRRYAAVAASLLVVVGTGSAIALVTR